MEKFGFGLMRLPILDTNNPQSIDLPHVEKMVDYYLEHGFNYFDTGYPYHQGESEAAVKTALVKRHPRESFILADKMPTFVVTAGSDYPRIFDEQLKRCGVEYFDNYLLHNLGEKNYADTLKHGGFEYVQKLKNDGKVKRIGFSFHDKADVLERILNEHPEMEFVQLQINYIDWDSSSVESRLCYEVATRHKKPVIVMEPVKGGSLANLPKPAENFLKSVRPDSSSASWAMRYAASLPNVSTVLSGVSSLEQMKDNVSFMKDFKPLNDEERKTIAEIISIINSINTIPCTDCQYCVHGCPQSIPIPRFFSLYNDQKRFKFLPNHAAYYMNLTQTYGKASDCVECDQCTDHCPQHINVPEQLKEIAKIFEGK